MNIVFTWEDSALAAPQSFRDAMQTAANILDGVVLDDITVNILVGYGDYNNNQQSGLTDTSVGAPNASAFTGVSYSDLRAALLKHETSAYDRTFVNSLPNTSSVNGHSFFLVPSAVAKALGMLPPSTAGIDGAIGMGTDIPANQLVGVALHEITHAMGRVPGWAPFDLLQFTSPGKLPFVTTITSGPTYFSIDGGATPLAAFGQTSDDSDFLQENSRFSVPNDVLDEFYDTSVENPNQTLTDLDKEILDVLGFNINTAMTAAVFAGKDASGTSNLWITNGTASGTSEISVAGAYAGGLSPNGFTAFGSEVLFAGFDTNYNPNTGDGPPDFANLWVTDGTSAGTSELAVAGADAGGLNPSGFTVFGNQVLFNGIDQSGHFGLWVTDGTAAGTSELAKEATNDGPAGFTVFGSSEVLFAGAVGTSGQSNLWATDGTAASELSVAGANAAGLDPSQFTPLGSEVLFTGLDPQGFFGLWVTDGTAGGTSEIPVADAFAEAGSGGFGPSDLTLFGGEVLFEGLDSRGQYNLWVTDGTASGTSEIQVAGTLENQVAAGRPQAGTLAGDLAPTNFIVLGSEVLFVGYDPNANRTLWVTDGTAAGTSELLVAGTYPSFPGFNPGGFTVFGSEVLFAGKDASGDNGLWVTDGTAAGTSELSVPGALATGVSPSGFTVVGSEVLFVGTDASGKHGLWTTNGTSDGTSELSIDGAFVSGLLPRNLTAVPLSVSTGEVADGYLSAATVFADANDNGVLDPGEVSTTTDQNGAFNLSGGSGHLVAVGGIDTLTGLPFKGQLSAPAGYRVITPLTTLVDDLQALGVSSADQVVMAAFGLSPTLDDLSTLDPIAATENGDTVGAAAEVAGAEVYDTVSLIASGLAGAGDTFSAGAKDTFAAIASAIENGGIDLTNQTAVTALIAGIAQSELIQLAQGAAADIASIVAASNTALVQKGQADGAGNQLLLDTATIELVTQGAASNAIQQADNDPAALQSVVAAFTGSNNPGPSVVDITTAGEKVAHGTTVAVGSVTPGSPGDMLRLTELTGPAGAVTLSNGIVNFAAPANASGNVAFSYQISDQLGDLSPVISDTLAIDPGPSVADTTTAGEKVAHGTTLAVGSVMLGLPGDMLTLTELTGPAGAVTLNNGIVSFAAPANASGNVAFSYQISDQVGDLSTVISDTLAIDPGPSVADTTTAGEKVAHGTTVAVGGATAGLPGDVLTLTELTGPAGAVTLSNGIVNFAAPANASGNIAFSYQISDELGDLSPVISDTLAVDPGPSVADTTTGGEKVAHGTTVAIGTATPGLPGDMLTLTELTGPAGAVTLDNGVVSFAAPANASGNVAFSYQISDELGDLSPVISDTLAVDPGPSEGNAYLYTSPGLNLDLTGQLLALDTPGLPGDTLTLSAIGTAGTLGNVSLIHGDLSYTAPAVGSSDVFTYTVSDQLHETATAGVNVSLLSKNGNAALAGSGNIVITTDGNRTVTGGSGGNYVSLGGGNDSVSLGGDNNTVVLGNGNDSSSLSGEHNIVWLGNGNDSVTAGDGSMITLGDGNDLVYAGANSTVVVGNGNNSVFAGANDLITIGTGHDVIAFGINGSLTIGNEVVTGFGKGDTLEFNRQLLGSFATAMSDARQMGADTVITIDPNDSVTLRGVAMTSLTTNSFKFA